VSSVLPDAKVRNAVGQVYAAQRLPMVRLATFLLRGPRRGGGDRPGRVPRAAAPLRQICGFARGGSPRATYRTPSSQHLDTTLEGPSFDGQSVLFTSEPDGSGAHRSPGPSHVGVVDVRSGETRIIYTQTGSLILRPPILVNGVVYWGRDHKLRRRTPVLLLHSHR
jgi:hypothetical protein